MYITTSERALWSFVCDKTSVTLERSKYINGGHKYNIEKRESEKSVTSMMAVNRDVVEG